MRACEKLAIKTEILEHEIASIKSVLINEKGRRKRNKVMGLFFKNKLGQVMFFSLSKIAAMKAHQDQLEVQMEQEKLQKEQERQLRAIEKERKALEAKEWREFRQKKLAEKRALKEQKKEARKLQKQVNQQLRLEQKTQKNHPKPSTRPGKWKRDNAHPVEVKRHESKLARSGWSIALPERYQV